MNAHKRLQVSGRGGIETARHLRRIFATSVLVAALLVFSTAPRASAETYDAVNSHSIGFSTVSGTYHNDTQYIDAVYFGGREIIFFTLQSDYQAEGKNQYLHFYTDSPSYSGKLDIGNSSDLHFRFKLVAVNDVLYVFYTTDSTIASWYGYSTSTIYYRTATVDYGATGQDWKLVFSDKKSFAAGVSPVRIRMAQMMNGTISVIYSADSTWYSMSSSDGLNFGSKTTLFTASSIKGAGGAVFQVPDTTEGSVDRLMIAYATGSAVNCYFFDGNVAHGPYTIATTGLTPYSVRLFAGSAKGYSDSKYSIQVFITSPSNGSATWHSIYHGEYSPAGVNGDQGWWSSTWTDLNLNGGDDDHVKTYDNDNSSDRMWAVIPCFTSEAANAGTFTLTFRRQTTSLLAYNASAAQVQTALNSLSTIGGYLNKDGVPGSVKVGLAGNVYTVTFGGSLANTDVDQMFADGSNGTFALVATKTPGGGVSEVQTVTVSGANVQMYLRIWAYRGGSYYWSDAKDHVNFRRISYVSDLLKYQGRQKVPVGEQDLTTSPVVGVLEGTPPYPVNEGVEKDEANQTSTVELEATSSTETSTTWTVSSSIVFSFGQKFEKKEKKLGGWQAKLSGGLEYTKGSKNSTTVKRSDSLQNFTHEPPGDQGWVLVLKPEIINDQYQLMAYDGNALHYGSDTSGDEVMASVISYGSGTILTMYAYYLQNPSAWIGGSDSYPDIFKGMTARPLSTDVEGWKTVVKTDDPSYIPYTLPTVSGTSGRKSELKYVETTTDITSITPSAGFSVSGAKLGFINWGAKASVDFSMDIETKTSMKYSVGWNYNMPACGELGFCCVGYMDVSPYLLVPNDDVSGYNAPWISDDIRTYQKPKPWCLSYKSYPSNPCSTGAPYVKLTVDRAQGTLFLDESEPNHDRALARLTLKGLDRGFSLDSLSGEQLVHMRLGNYIVNSDTNYVLSRGIQGNDLILRLKESEDSDSFITMRLSHNKAKSRLDIDLDADRTDLTGLFAYRFLDTDESSGDEAKTVPFRLFLGDKYHAEGELDVRCAVNAQNAICNLHSK